MIDAEGTLYVIPPYANVMREENSSWHNIQEKSLNSTNIYMYYSSPSCRLVIIQTQNKLLSYYLKGVPQPNKQYDKSIKCVCVSYFGTSETRSWYVKKKHHFWKKHFFLYETNLCTLTHIKNLAQSLPFQFGE